MGPPLPTPALTVSRPALRLLSLVGHGCAGFTFEQAVAASGDPTSTVARHLSELVQSELIVRLHKDVYATPGKPTHALLLVEHSAYVRSLLLHAEVLGARGAPFAFACAPVRQALPFEIPRALPVLDLETPAPHVLRHDAVRLVMKKVQLRTETWRFPSDAASDAHAAVREIPTLPPQLALAVLAATADPRLVHAAVAAAEKLRLSPQKVLDKAASFVVEDAVPKRVLPNALVLPDWLTQASRAAKGLHAQRFLDSPAALGTEGTTDG